MDPSALTSLSPDYLGNGSLSASVCIAERAFSYLPIETYREQLPKSGSLWQQLEGLAVLRTDEGYSEVQSNS